MNIFAKRFDKVVFTAEGGWEREQEAAKKVLNIGEEYCVDYVDIGSWFSYVTLIGVDGRFNTCLFKDKEEQ